MKADGLPTDSQTRKYLFESADRITGNNEIVRRAANTSIDTRIIARRMVEAFWTLISTAQLETELL